MPKINMVSHKQTILVHEPLTSGVNERLLVWGCTDVKCGEPLAFPRPVWSIPYKEQRAFSTCFPNTAQTFQIQFHGQLLCRLWPESIQKEATDLQLPPSIHFHLPCFHSTDTTM